MQRRLILGTLLLWLAATAHLPPAITQALLVTDHQTAAQEDRPATAPASAEPTCAPVTEAIYLPLLINGGAPAANQTAESEEEYDRASNGELSMAGVVPTAFNPITSTVDLTVTCATFGLERPLTALLNGTAIPTTSLSLRSNHLTIGPVLQEGPNHLTVLAKDTYGYALGSEVDIWAGSNQLEVILLDSEGARVDGTVITATLVEDHAIQATAASVRGVARFANLPNRAIALEADTGDGHRATLIATGDAQYVTLRLSGDFPPPSLIDNNDFQQGLAGWNVGPAAVSLIAHVEGPLPPSRPSALAKARAVIRRFGDYVPTPTHGSPAQPAPGSLDLAATDTDLSLRTLGLGTQAVSRTFATLPGTVKASIRYRFVTTEISGGYFGTQYDDSFFVGLHSQRLGLVTAINNSMNGLGLPAFDAGGATQWYELSVPVDSRGDTVQLDLTVRNIADDQLESAIVIDFVQEATLAASANRTTGCINQPITFSATGTGTITWAGGGTPASGSGNSLTTRFGAAGPVTVTGTLTTTSGPMVVSRGQVPLKINEPSGAAWVARFQGMTTTDGLDQPFRGNVERFIAALEEAGANVHISATYRPPARGYLMHYAYHVAHGTIAPQNVPTYPGVDICWVHYNANGTTNLTQSRAAAQAMVDAYHIAYEPSLTSNHYIRQAIDMDIGWTGNLTIRDSDGTAHTIASLPRTGAENTDLHQFGAIYYHVLKLVSDRPHWSSDGG